MKKGNTRERGINFFAICMQLECIIVGERPIRSKTNGPGLENLPGRFVSSSSHLPLSPSFVRYHNENERAQLPIKKRGTVLSVNEHCSGQIGDSGIPAGQTVKAALFLPLSVRLPPDGFRAEKPTPLDRGPRFLSSVLYGV